MEATGGGRYEDWEAGLDAEVERPLESLSSMFSGADGCEPDESPSTLPRFSATGAGSIGSAVDVAGRTKSAKKSITLSEVDLRLAALAFRSISASVAGVTLRGVEVADGTSTPETNADGDGNCSGDTGG